MLNYLKKAVKGNVSMLPINGFDRFGAWEGIVPPSNDLHGNLFAATTVWPSLVTTSGWTHSSTIFG